MARETTTMNKGTAIVGFVLSFVTGAGFMYAVDRGANKGDDVASADNLDSIRLALADTKQALQQVAQARPAAGGAAARGGRPDPTKRYTVKTDGAPAKGPASAKVKIVEFSDFQ